MKSTCKKLTTIRACSIVVLIILSAVLSCGCVQEQAKETKNQSAIVVTDALGNTLSLSSPAQRIVVSGADIATVLLMLGADDQVIGVGDSIKKDAQIAFFFREKKSIGGLTEKIVSLKPDLVLKYASSQTSETDDLKKTGIPVGYFDCYKQDRLVADIEALGKITGKEVKADELTSYISSIVTLVRERTGDVPLSNRPRVYFELGDYKTAAHNSGGDHLVTTAGGQNVAGNTTLEFMTVTPEWIIHENPDVIVKVGTPAPGRNLSDMRDDVSDRPGFSAITAVRNGRVYAIDTDIMYGGQSCIGLLYLAAILYPDRFRDINTDEYLDEFTKKFYPRNATPVIYPALYRSELVTAKQPYPDTEAIREQSG